MTTIRVPPSVTSITTAADALHGEEVDRTRSFIRMAWVVAAFVAASTLVLPGDPRIRTALIATLGVGIAGSTWVYRELGDKAKNRARMLNVLMITAVICGQLRTARIGLRPLPI